MNKEQKNQIEEKLNDEVEDTKKKIPKYKYVYKLFLSGVKKFNLFIIFL